MHPEAYEFVERAAAAHGPFRRVVEVGGRDVNGSVRGLFGEADYTSVDIADGPGVDVVADAVTWKPIGAADCVVCCEVLEHLYFAPALLDNVWTWLEPDGIVLLTCATAPRPAHHALTGDLITEPTDEWYANVPPPTLRMWMSRFAIVETAVHPRGDLYAVARR